MAAHDTSLGDESSNGVSLDRLHESRAKKPAYRHRPLPSARQAADYRQAGERDGVGH